MPNTTSWFKQAAGALRTGWPLLTTLLLLLPTLPIPMGWDQSVYAYIGWGILHGYAPYKDAWAQNAPGNFFVYAAAFRLFGETASSVALLGVVEVMAGTGAVMVAAHQLLGSRYTAVAGLLFGATAALGLDFPERQEPEAPMAVAVTLVVVVMVAAQRAPKWAQPAWACAGALAAGCVLLKPTGGVVVLLAPAIPLILGEGVGYLRRLRWWIPFTVGAFVPMVPVAVYLWVTGSVPNFFEQVVVYNVHYVGSFYAGNPTGPMSILVIETLLLMGPVPLMAAAGIGLALRRIGTKPSIRLLLFWAGMTYLAVAVQSFHHIYHQLFSLPACSLLGAVAVVHWRGLIPRTRIALYAAGLGLAVYAGAMGIYFPPRLVTYASGVPFALGMVGREGYLGQFRTLGSDPPYRAEVARYLELVSPPQDRIFVIGEASIYFESKRRAPTALFQELPLWNARDPAAILAQLSQDLADAPPRYIVVHHQLGDFFRREQELVIGAIKPLVTARYALDRTIDRFQLYRLRDG